MRATASLLDSSAIALSGLCLLHCLALPLLAATLPLLGAWSRAEWVHVVFATAAVPMSGYALWSTHRRHALPAPVWVLALCGLAGLVIVWSAMRWRHRSRSPAACCWPARIYSICGCVAAHTVRPREGLNNDA